jgi:hypothetical protein
MGQRPRVDRRRRTPLHLLLRLGADLFDALDRRWEALLGRRTLGVLLVLAFLGAILVIEVNRLGLLPPPLGPALTTNHFGAVAVAFTLLLVVEILALVFALARSVSISVGKQFELFSLILLRKAFIEFGQFGEPIEWANVADSIPVVLSDIVGALAIFAVVGLYYRIQRHQPITAGEEEQASFIAAKKLVALALLAAFLILAVDDLYRLLTGQPTYAFFEAFFTVLIFSDVLIVLISLAYTSSYHIVFRNSGFAAATVILRLALTAPDYINAVLGLSAALLAVALSLAYNYFTPEMKRAAPTPAP